MKKGFDLPAYLTDGLKAPVALAADDSDQVICNSYSCNTDGECSADGTCSGYSSCPRYTPCADCADCGDAPVNAGRITSVMAYSTEIHITYTSIPKAQWYEIAYRRSGSSATTYETTSNLYYTITGLQPNTTYVVNYRGVNSYGDGVYGTGVTVTTESLRPSGTVSVYTGSGYEAATPYIYDGSRFVKAVPYVYTGGGWKKVSHGG